jgi:hypothetical protein
MTSNFYGPKTNVLTIKVRISVAFFVPIMMVLGVFSVYWLSIKVLPIYGRIYREAPVVEVSYSAFALLMGPSIAILAIFGGTIAVITGKIFDPPKGTWVSRFSIFMLATSIYSLIYVAPAAATLTTLTLYAKDYWPCRALRISGPATQVFWVNDERVCFKPDEYINDNWPCRNEGNKLVCIQVDGR